MRITLHGEWHDRSAGCEPSEYDQAIWALYAGQTTGAPTLTIVPAGSSQATISWSSATGTNWALQETPSLSPANCTNSPSGSTNPIDVPATLLTKFYRLFKP